MSPVKIANLIKRSCIKFMRECPVYGFKNLERSLSDKSLPFYNFNPNLNPLKYIQEKYGRMTEFYEDFAGLKQLKEIQGKVEEAGVRLSTIQDERRKAYSALLEIQNQLKGIHSELENTKRGDERYIPLITREDRLLRQEEEMQKNFKDIEKSERDQFILFSILVKSSHEHEKNQSQKFRYMSIIGSVVGTMVGFITSTIHHYIKKSELKQLIAESSNSNLEVKLNKYFEEYKKSEKTVGNKFFRDSNENYSGSGSSEIQKCLNDALDKMNAMITSLEESVKVMEGISNFEMYDKYGRSNLLLLNLKSFKDTIHCENENLQMYMWKLCLIIVCATILSKIF